MPEYNGWTNYETWCVSLWMHNDPGDADWMTGKARDAIAAASDHPDPAFDGAEPFAQARYLLTRMLRDAFDEMMPEIDGMWGNLLSAAFENVNWRELADYEICAVLDTDEYREVFV